MIYWDNYDQGNLGFANADGTGGGVLNFVGATIESPEGMAYDPANGRIYIASSGANQIVWVNIGDGSAGVLRTGVAPVSQPNGIAVDLVTQTVYWANGEDEAAPIGYAAADDSGVGSALNVTGTVAGAPIRLALDTGDERIYWVFEGKVAPLISWAALDGSGGHTFSTSVAEMPEGETGLAIDPMSQRLYFLGQTYADPVEGLYWVSLEGSDNGIQKSPNGAVDTRNALLAEPFGLAFDPTSGRFYWANYESEPGEPNFGMATLSAGGGGGLTIFDPEEDLTAGPSDPIILKSPVGLGAPQITASGITLGCSQGTWSQNYVGSYVYAEPESYAYQWSKDGQEIPGATSSTLNVASSGSFSCKVTAANRFGSASLTSSGDTVTIAPPATAKPAPASFALARASKKKVKVAAGKAAVLPLTLKNVGGTASSSSKVCVKLTKKAKKGLVASKCASVAALAPGASKKVTLKVKTKGGAKGTYKFSVVVSGASGSRTLAEQITVTPKKHGKKKHGKK